ncbi:uncharacterized protein B0I36DRAFT_357360 [Microdochium trichocladiopsis]|uniref:Potassium channel tetramerisation-type BTB domain-containing protein n=1 Tax=Microdochium trichocladiopsis TaxID=1682393 RepID=A0A9P8YJ62_9PEZI|nr:uncharacterized protein B0I36DRAFT_357360 [Microdochium trichocladiopsis]KAH7039999.1 hypothetical protein B0I36DRAFT_357360 [Microdochium trichocladiopsis]
MNHPSRNGTPNGGPKTFSLPPSGPKLIGAIPRILPHERVFPIQIGCDLFKLSGASLSSDAPSYFSQYFLSQIKQAEEHGQDVSTAIRTLYIDRDPVTFKDISLHLQGYHIKPKDGQHFVRLFADAQFYTLPKLMSQLYEESIFVAIGGQEFQLGRELMQDAGNSPNFFSLGFAAFFTTPDQIFPGLNRENLIRPPSIAPPIVANRSAEVFGEIMQLLRGYPVHIRNEEHRASLLRDCRYFNFKKVEQKLIPHAISYNQARRREEIVLRVEDILKSGISIFHEGFSAANLGARRSSTPTSSTGSTLGSSMPGSANPHHHHRSSFSDPGLAAWVHYARPFEDDKPYELILEIGGESTKLHTSIMRAEFFGSVKARVAKLFEVVATKLNLPPTTQPLGLLMASGGASSQPATPGNTPLSEDLVRVVIEPDAHVILDGRVFEGFSSLMAAGTGSATADVEEMTHAMSTASSIGNNNNNNNNITGSSGGQGYGDSPMSATATVENNNNNDYPGTVANFPSSAPASRKRKRLDMASAWTTAGGVPVPDEWIVRTGQWRLRIQGTKGGKSAVECVLVAVKIDAYSCERARNAQRGFLAAPKGT